MKRRAITYPFQILLTALTFATQGQGAGPAEELAKTRKDSLKLWYNEPAKDWMRESLPLGNGRLGCMVFGGVKKERIQFNEDSLWLGSESDTGAYQAFGDVYIEFAQAEATGYRRELDITRAVHTVTYASGGTNYKREYFSSAPAQVMVFRFTADRGAAYTGKITLVDAHEAVAKSENSRITAVGSTEGKRYKKMKGHTIPLTYEAQLLVLNDGGALKAVDGSIVFEGCNSLTVLIGAGTDYLNQQDKGWKGDHPHDRITGQLKAAEAKTYADLLSEHLKDYRTLFDRLAIDLGNTDDAVLQKSCSERMLAYKGGAKDPDLEELMFQYGRYLLISCSRPGGLPANLQGLWNESNSPPWRCDYHSNINVQMNYWLAEPANLAECHQVFADYVFSLRGVAKRRTREQLQNKHGRAERGWTVKTENGIFGGSTFKWNYPGSAWYAQHLWEHYAFGRDKTYLRTLAYPVLKEICQFWEDRLETRPDGTLVAPEGWSPEHGPREDGVSYEQQIVYDLFTNYMEASRELEIDEDYRKRIANMRSALLKPRIGKWGQLQEWERDLDKRDDKHRHVSHLFALHPGRQITAETPELLKAAKVSLNARGDGGTGWSKAWKISFWARLHDGDRAYKLIRSFMELTDGIKTNYNEGGGLYSNMLCAHPPFQIDGNLGATAGITEMLLQSHITTEDGSYVIHLLPALPSNWPKGSVKGLRARGGFEVDIDWAEGKLGSVTLKAVKGTTCMIRYKDAMHSVTLQPGASSTFNASDIGKLSTQVLPGR